MTSGRKNDWVAEAFRVALPSQGSSLSLSTISWGPCFMLFPLVSLHVTVLWLYATDPVTVEQPGESITATPSLAVDYGHVIGAADRCKEINQKRIFAAIVKATLLLRLQSKSKDEFSLAAAQLNAAMEEGSSAVDYGSVTCKQADQGLGSIETQKIKRVK